jgi:hypothetical protein
MMQFLDEGITDPNFKSENYINPKNNPAFKSLLSTDQSRALLIILKKKHSLQEIEFDDHFDRDFVDRCLLRSSICSVSLCLIFENEYTKS